MILLSRHYMSDPWFYHEMPALFALEQTLKSDLLIPVLLNGIADEQVPQYLRSRPSIDLRTSDLDSALPELLELLEQRRKRRASEVFIVHGHGTTRDSVARFIEKLGLTPVILEEQINAGGTLVEKLERNRDVGCAVVILTPDDVGASRETPDDLHPRPRQNVVFEMGFFMGILERHRVCALLSGFTGPPTEFSNFSGIVYISMDRGDWQAQLARELQAHGFIFDPGKLL